MALDTTAAATCANSIADALGFTGSAKIAQVAVYTAIVGAIFDQLKTSAVVSPAGVPPMSNAGGTVGGTGKIL